MKKTIVVIFTATLLYACGKPCFETRGIEGAGLTITFFHTANNEYFYPVNTNLSPFNIDSLRVDDSKMQFIKNSLFFTTGFCKSFERIL